MTTLSSPKSETRKGLRALTSRVAKDYVNPYYAGILLGVVLFGAFFLTGNGLGASGGLNRLLVVVEDAIVLIDREQGGKANLAAAGITGHSVLTFREVMAVLVDAGRLTTEKQQEVLAFLAK